MHAHPEKEPDCERQGIEFCLVGLCSPRREEFGQETKAKARWCVLGNKDQEAYHVARLSPNPAALVLMMVLVPSGGTS